MPISEVLKSEQIILFSFFISVSKEWKYLKKRNSNVILVPRELLDIVNQRAGNVSHSWKAWLSFDNDT